MLAYILSHPTYILDDEVGARAAYPHLRTLRNALLLAGSPPFRDRNRKELYRKILSEKLSFPRFLSPNAVSLIRGLLERNVEKRLGE